ncbi:MAG: type II secretion system protein GspD [Chlamydiae bacterium]|nr:type II secretion system protein GspD [Chlamydiota bacterium]
MRWPFYLFFLVIGAQGVRAEESALYTVNFQDIPMVEFVRFVSKISKENFIFDQKELEFHISFSSGQPVSSENIVRTLVRLLQVRRFQVVREEGCFVIHREGVGLSHEGKEWDPSALLSANDEMFVGQRLSIQPTFSVYKVQYHEGGEIVQSLKQMAGELTAQEGSSARLVQAIQTLQWVKTTNSLLFSGDEQTIAEMNRMIASLDTPLRQVFIEILVIETDVKNGLDFGLQWAVGGKYAGRVGGGMGNFAPPVPGGSGPSFAHTMQASSPSNPPQGLSQIPLVPGFDLGVIGDIIMHKGCSYLTLGSLVSALQNDTDSTIVLNQKLITQDHKHSKIFVGDNIPFTGSVVTTVGQSQQTTANIEYRDVGVSLSITPMLGEDDVITLSLDEEITEAVCDVPSGYAHVNGIRTTKTNMTTNVHVPDKNFLVLSGMIRNAKATHKSGIPCLGGLPWVGALFSRSRKHEEKRNIVIFVRPQIIHSIEEYRRITQNQESLFAHQANAEDFHAGVEILQAAAE